MASAIDGEQALEALRGKYAELTRKYAFLVDRFEGHVGEELAIYRLGSFGLRASGAALAMVGSGGIRLANARFTQLARKLGGPLEPVEPSTGPQYRTLRTLVMEHAERLLERRSAASRLRYRDAASK